jgi:Ca2+-binding EF-hand superfamily protein
MGGVACCSSRESHVIMSEPEIQEVKTHIRNYMNDNDEDHIRKVYGIFDKKHTGKLSKYRLKSVCSYAFGDFLPDIEIEAMIKEADRSGSGDISMSEFVEVF